MRPVTTFLALASLLLASVGRTGLPEAGGLAEPAPHFEAAPGRSEIGQAFVAAVPGHRVLVAPGSVCVAPEGGATSDVIRFELVGADRGAIATPEETLPSVSHYLLGADRAAWRTGVAHHSVLRYGHVLPGVDVVYRIEGGCVRTDFVLAPGADPAALRLRVTGGRSVRLDEASGDLVVKSARGEARFSAPRTFQSVDGTDVPVGSRFVRRGGRRFGVRVGGHDRGRPLVIDPTIEYSSYVGTDTPLPLPLNAIATDPAGALYVFMTGVDPAEFPATPGAYLTTTAWDRVDALRKYDPTGRQILWTTFLLTGSGPAAPNEAVGSVLAVDARGAAWLIGYGRAGMPEVGSLLPPPPVGVSHAHALRLSPDGDALEFASYLGPASFRFADLADNGDMCLAGRAEPGYEPLINSAWPEPSPSSEGNVFVMKLAGDDSAILFSTYLYTNTTVDAIRVDATGRMLLLTHAWEGLADRQPIDAPIGWEEPFGEGNPCSHLARLSPDGQTLDLAFFLPVSSGARLAVLATSDFTVLGHPLEGFPTLNTPAWSRNPRVLSQLDGDLGFIGFDVAGEPRWAGTLGGSDREGIYALEVTSTGGLLFGGDTASVDLPVVSAFQPTYSGGRSEGFVGQLSADGRSLEWLSYLGGGVAVTDWGLGTASMDTVFGLADSPVTGAPWILTHVGSQDFPVTRDALVPIHPRANEPRIGFELWPFASVITRLSSAVRPNLREPSALDLRPLVMPLNVGRGGNGRLILGWEETTGGHGFSVSIGRVHSLRNDRAYDHRPVSAATCNVMMASADIPMPVEDSYFIVTAVRKDPVGGDEESSYGRDSFGSERPAVPPAERCP